MYPWHGLWRLSLWLSRKLLFLWVRTRTLDAQLERLKALADKPLCYVLEHPGLADMAVLEQECIRHGLPRPGDGLAQGGLKEWRAVAYLRRKPRRSRKGRPGRLERLAAAVQAGQVDDVVVVPVSVFWGRSPDKERSVFKLLFSEGWALVGRLRKLFMMVFHGRNVLVQFSEPVLMSQLVTQEPNPALVARKLGRVLRVHFRRLRIATIGPDLSHRRTLLNQVVASDSVRRAIRRYSEVNKQPLHKAVARARRYANEIAANYSYTTVRIGERVLTWLWNRLYDGVEVGGVDRLKAVSEGNEVVYVPCHRSHIDYLLLSYVVYQNGLVPPHIAAGVNLNLPVIGPILRTGGAFFMRRSFRDDPLYAAVFRRYFALNLAKGVAMEYFIEGGRSRTGRLLPAKPGMLAMTVRAYLREPVRPVVFVPVYFGYERLFEGRSYISELSGRPKEKESVLGIFKALRHLRREFGRVHVNFGAPFFLDGMLERHRPGWRSEPVEEDERPGWTGPVVEELGEEILRRINAAAAVSPVNLLAMVLLATPRQSMVEQPLVRLLELFAEMLRQVPYDEGVTVTELGGAEMIAYGERLGLLERRPHRLGDVIMLAPKEALLATYFRNNVAHLFAIPSIIACCFIDKPVQAVERVRGLARMVYPYLGGELFLHWTPEQLEVEVDRVIDMMVGRGLLRRDSEGEQACLRRPAPHTPEAIQMWILAQCSVQTLERFYMTVALLAKHGSGTLRPGQLEDLCHLMAQRMSMLFQFSAPEFFDKSLFRGFIGRLRKHGVLRTDETGLLVFDQSLVQAMDDARQFLGDRLRNDILQAMNL
ncbi:glycerol-3-phosphate 1-O-acyltransferase PlsB [Thioalkalivibrio sp. XN279]|uniref:glycerol-3-phosphate 1-O-acyltransferase PlsB n=1 Tax=Thioalkalivibrio sp. XN279 TaxID=2714953 RepID=UPI00140D14A4|nr:glycerol-3-phosphate 1-O-acyltransferase PlsB [Thioalkalivibrio sp. XN279]NHA13411.1 glycerol-3-phosphate 1-O-acyltransferase PlsB [Thioalkalivibrio sp. XN279]